jgi:potassium-transporting ATPase potassium-binding subunit
VASGPHVGPEASDRKPAERRWEREPRAGSGRFNSALFATVTTDTSCGAVNAMHDSFTPLGGMVPLVNIQLGEVIFGGVGSGLYGMLLFAILSLFIAGLMVGRTPEYVGKKLESREVKMAILALLAQKGQAGAG